MAIQLLYAVRKTYLDFARLNDVFSSVFVLSPSEQQLGLGLGLVLLARDNFFT